MTDNDSDSLPPEFRDAETEAWSAHLDDRVARRKHLVRWLVVAGVAAYIAIAVIVQAFGR